MNLAEITIKNKLISMIVIILTFGFGWSAYQNMARFEDPEFTIRTAQIFIQYPGASPREVAEEVTEPMERAIQQLQEVDKISSTSSDGTSELKVDIKFEYSKSKEDLQLIWTKLRNKVKDAEASLPPGAKSPQVFDDFGDVYGLSYLITGEGYSADEIRAYAKYVQSELLLVDGVAKVSLAGELGEAIFVEISRENAARLGVSVGNIYQILEKQNAVASAGSVRLGDQRMVIQPTGVIDSVEAIRNLMVTTSNDGSIVYLKDLAEVYRGYQEPPSKLIRYQGQTAIALGVASELGGNVVKIFGAVDDKLKKMADLQPLGMEIHEFYNQGTVVQASVDDFVVNVVVALIIVIVTLLLFMGIQSALVIGAVLLLTIFATLATMNFVDIPMHRISLGALIIALGMMVDNAIVVTEGILVGVKQGRKKLEIAKEIITQTKWPLLGGTLVGIVAFAPIGLAPGSTAEFTGHLFWVIMISLLFSWVFAVTITPMFCHWLFKEHSGQAETDAKPNPFMEKYRSVVAAAIKHRVVSLGITIAIFAVALYSFQFVKSGFFPASTTPQLVVDYWLPQGTDIRKTEQDMIALETFALEQPGVDGVQTLIGGGGLRYMLVYGGESPNGSYGQLLIKVDDFSRLDGLLVSMQNHMDANFPNAQGKAWRFVLGPGGGSKIEATFKGPDPEVLRGLAEQAKAIMIADGGALSIKDNWRQPVSVIEPIFSESKGRRAGISREDVAKALQQNFSGRNVGVFREGSDLIPIVARAPANERQELNDIGNIQVQNSSANVPLAQVTDGFRTIWRDGVIKREDRIWTIKAQSDPYPGELASALLERIRPDIEAIELPEGYTLEWDGEIGNSSEANGELMSTIPMGFMTMVLIVVVLFNAIRQPLVIWSIVPLALIGVVFGLIVTDKPLEFMGILGLLSLSGLLIKNAIVLVDQIDLEISQGKPEYQAVIDSAVSRVRPVMMGTLTTVLGVIPLFFDAFFQSMSVVLVFGLSFATLLTLILIPVIYSVFFGIRPDSKA